MLSINALLQVIQTVAEAHSQINKFLPDNVTTFRHRRHCNTRVYG